MRDFSATTLRSLRDRGISVCGITVIPDDTSSMPYANGSRGYMVNDKGYSRVWTFQQVLEAAQ